MSDLSRSNVGCQTEAGLPLTVFVFVVLPFSWVRTLDPRQYASGDDRSSVAPSALFLAKQDERGRMKPKEREKGEAERDRRDKKSEVVESRRSGGGRGGMTLPQHTGRVRPHGEYACSIRCM